MKILLTVLLSLVITIISIPIVTNGCFEVERDALLTFKAGLYDPGKLISSWHGQHCCNWSGITCDDVTHHVVKLILRNPYNRYIYHSDDSYSNWISHALTGEINPSLLSVSHLTHLDLSNHNFSNISIPKFISSFQSLVYLNLSLSGFQGIIPYELENLSRLQFLDLGDSYFTGMVPSQIGNLSDLRYLSLRNSYLVSVNNNWLYRLSNLRYLDMSLVNLSNIFDWTTTNNMHMLETLILCGCSILEIPTDMSHINLTSLTKFDLSFNSFHATLPNWLWNLTNLLFLDLSYSEFHGSIPPTITNLTSLNYFSITSNNISGNISSWITHMRNLSFIYLGSNSLSGHIPSEIGSTLTQLKELDLTDSSLSGVITEAHFFNLSNLETLCLSNSMITLKMNDQWMPPFQLQYLALASCKVGPEFPRWLRGQIQLWTVLLTNTSITGPVPNWFWNMQSLQYVYMEYNNITGNLPTSFQFSKIQYLGLGSNNITGPIPTIWGAMQELDFSENQINGSIPYNICEIDLYLLDFSNNAITGEIPNCWKNTSNLTFIDLSNNRITGELPSSIGSLQHLNSLQLDNNKLHGEIPSNLQQCKNLVFLSLARNNFSGKIPLWIGKQLQDLVVLQLRSNNFSGYIPPELGELSNLQILDLAHNSLVGLIPSSVGKFYSMKNSSKCYNSYFTLYEDILYIDINGQDWYESRPLECAKVIDISGNKINGQIPEEIWQLEAVISLKLSKNHLIGEISGNIGGMRYLESLDLSFNHLSGPISQALSTLFSLHNLNLSYNNFSGKIPTGRQLDTLSDSSIYVGNFYLCGPPTDKNCSEDQSSVGIDSAQGYNGEENVWFYLASALGFILGFWSVWGVLIFQNARKVAHFQMIDRLFDKIYVHIVFGGRRLGWW